MLTRVLVLLCFLVETSTAQISTLNSNQALRVADSLISEPLSCLAGGAKILSERWRDRSSDIQASLLTMPCSLLHMPPLAEQQTRTGRQRWFDGSFHIFPASISVLSFAI